MEMFRVLQIQKTSCIFKVWKIDLKLCTYFTEEITYLLFDRKKSGPFQTLRCVGLKAGSCPNDGKFHPNIFCPILCSI